MCLPVGSFLLCLAQASCLSQAGELEALQIYPLGIDGAAENQQVSYSKQIFLLSSVSPTTTWHILFSGMAHTEHIHQS